MSDAVERALGRAAARVVDAAQRRPRAVLALALVLTAASGWVAATGLRVDSDPDRMTSPELPFRRTNAELEASFPELTDNLVVLVGADTPAAARAAAERLAGLLEGDAEHVSSVFLPGADPFFEAHGLAYLDLERLRWVGAEVEASAPLLVGLEGQPRLAELARIAAAGLAGDGADDLERSAIWLEALARSLEGHLAGAPRPLVWHELLLPPPPPPRNPQILLVQPTRDFRGFGPAEQSIAALRAAAARLEPGQGVRVRVTGDVAVLTEEMSMIRWQVVLASVGSLVLVAAFLLVALRSFRLFLATLSTLLVGLVWTAGFAALAVGHLNVLTTAFAVIYIGLGIDFGIHFALGFRERRALGEAPDTALRRCGRLVGSSLFFCALTTTIGFFAFLPTSYSGVAELGLISGTGIVLSLIATLTVLPALIALGLGRSGKLVQADRSAVDVALPGFPLRSPRAVLWVAALLGVAALFALPRIRFDSDPLNVRDPRVDSVRAMVEVLSDAETSPWTVEILARDLAEARALRPALEALPEVARVVTVDDFLPADPEAKGEILARARRALEPADPDPAAPGDLGGALAALREAVARDAARRDEDDWRPGVDALVEALARLDARLRDGPGPVDLARLERELFADLAPTLAGLRERLEAPPVRAEALPASLARRYLGREGRARVEVHAAENLRVPGALERFADAVRRVRPDAGGPAVGTVELARTIVGALREALAWALAVIVLLLLLLWRSVRFTLIALTPLLLGALLTAAAAVLAGLPLNFANVIVLPLILGIGVDSGIHFVHRHRLHLRQDADILHTSTARGVLFSALTTLASIATLGFASHRGMASLAQLLTTGLTLVLLCNLIVLPALLARLDPARQASGEQAPAEAEAEPRTARRRVGDPAQGGR